MKDLYLVICRDQSNSKQARAASLQDHLKHIEHEIDKISLAAALKNENDEIVGSVMVVAADSSYDARIFVEKDPFFVANVWKHMEVARLGRTVGTWVDGTR